MAFKPSRQTILLGMLAVLVVVLVFRMSEPTPAVPGARPRGAAGAEAARDGAGSLVPDIKLDALGAARPELAGERRNPFRMGPTAPPAPSPDEQAPGRPDASPPQDPDAGAGTPPAPPPPPPIPLKFIGIVQSRAGRVAVLSDGRAVFHGREGEIIEGRYRIVRIGEESIEIEHADGRGRQTIRLTGV